jgi:PadR family transcriptional regulator
MTGTEVRGLLHPFLLLLLLERAGHGYDLIERLTGLGIPDVEPSHAYRVLRSLERREYVVSTWTPGGCGPARRKYELTAAGCEALAGWTERLIELDRIVDDYLARWHRVRTIRASPSVARTVAALPRSGPAAGGGA